MYSSLLASLSTNRRSLLLATVLARFFVVIWVGSLALYIPVVGMLASIVHAFVLQQLWGWFVVPIFHLPKLTLPLAIGLRLVLGFLTPLGMPENKRNEKQGEKQEKTRNDPIGPDGEPREPTKEEKAQAKRALMQVVAAPLMVVLVPLWWLAFGWVVKSYFLAP